MTRRAMRRSADWIAAGAPAGPADLKVTGIAVEPADLLLERAGESRQLRVTATLSDGTSREVSPLCALHFQ